MFVFVSCVFLCVFLCWRVCVGGRSAELEAEAWEPSAAQATVAKRDVRDALPISGQPWQDKQLAGLRAYSATRRAAQEMRCASQQYEKMY